MDRVRALGREPNAYTPTFKPEGQTNNVNTQEVEKVIFPEPYENAGTHYNKEEFAKPPVQEEPHQHNHQQQSPMFDFKSMLPMLMSGKFNDILKPLMSMFGGSAGGGGGLGDIAKIFEIFKPKKKKEKTEEDVSSKFDDLIIIED